MEEEGYKPENSDRMTKHDTVFDKMIYKNIHF